jgi:hypothetical protein
MNVKENVKQREGRKCEQHVRKGANQKEGKYGKKPRKMNCRKTKMERSGCQATCFIGRV